MGLAYLNIASLMQNSVAAAPKVPLGYNLFLAEVNSNVLLGLPVKVLLSKTHTAHCTDWLKEPSLFNSQMIIVGLGPTVLQPISALLWIRFI